VTVGAAIEVEVAVFIQSARRAGNAARNASGVVLVGIVDIGGIKASRANNAFDVVVRAFREGKVTNPSGWDLWGDQVGQVAGVCYANTGGSAMRWHSLWIGRDVATKCVPLRDALGNTSGILGDFRHIHLVPERDE